MAEEKKPVKEQASAAVSEVKAVEKEAETFLARLGHKATHLAAEGLRYINNPAKHTMADIFHETAKAEPANHSIYQNSPRKTATSPKTEVQKKVDMIKARINAKFAEADKKKPVVEKKEVKKTVEKKEVKKPVVEKKEVKKPVEKKEEKKVVKSTEHKK